MVKRVIRIGADPFPPYQYIDEQGEVGGSDYETVAEMFRSEGYDICVLIDEWSVIEEKFQKGELDALFQVQKNPEREEKYKFSPLLRNAVTEVITGNSQLHIESYSEIAQKKLSIGVLKGYAYGAEIDELPDTYKRFYGSSKELLRAVAQRETDLGVFDKGVKGYMMEQLGIKEIYAIKNLEFLRPLYVMYHSTPCL